MTNNNMLLNNVRILYNIYNLHYIIYNFYIKTISQMHILFTV